jgi:hypothetical protein
MQHTRYIWNYKKEIDAPEEYYTPEVFFMYCKLCGEHLYFQLSFVTLFKWKYEIHPSCENKLHIVSDTITFPMDALVVDYTYLFEIGTTQSDAHYIFTHYYNSIIKMFVNQREWSILVDLDDIKDKYDLKLILPMAKSRILMVSMFYEEMLS